MSQSESNAYDYSRFEEKKENHKIKEVKIKNKKTKKFSMLKNVLSILIAVTMVSTLLYCKAMQIELDSEYTSTVKEIDLLKAENTRLEIELESKLSLKNIEEIATERLGLEKINDQMIEYINFNEQDKIEVLQEKGFFEKIIDSVKDFFS